MFRIRNAVILLAVAVLCSCAVNENTYWAINDSNMYWDRIGYSVTAPSGSNWYKMPRDDDHPNAITFYKGEGLLVTAAPGKWVYMKGTSVRADGILLDKAIPQKDRLSALKKLLDSYITKSALTVHASSYDNSLGFDCLAYSATFKDARLPSERGEVSVKDATGYLCLNPQPADFLVLMESRNLSTVWTNTAEKNEQTGHLFRSLRFSPISSASTRMWLKNIRHKHESTQKN